LEFDPPEFAAPRAALLFGGGVNGRKPSRLEACDDPRDSLPKPRFPAALLPDSRFPDSRFEDPKLPKPRSEFALPRWVLAPFEVRALLLEKPPRFSPAPFDGVLRPKPELPDSRPPTPALGFILLPALWRALDSPLARPPAENPLT
jgi:hypothetical protein